MEAGGWILGTGTTSADFQIGGTNPSLIDELKMAASGWHRSELKSRRSQLGIPSGPGALWILIEERRLSTSEGSTTRSSV